MKKYCLNQESYYTNIKTNYDKKKSPAVLVTSCDNLKTLNIFNLNYDNISINSKLTTKQIRVCIVLYSFDFFSQKKFLFNKCYL